MAPICSGTQKLWPLRQLVWAAHVINGLNLCGACLRGRVNGRAGGVACLQVFRPGCALFAVRIAVCIPSWV
jgi:hypothetical protein